MRRSSLLCLVLLAAMVLACSSESKKEEHAQPVAIDVTITDEMVMLGDGEAKAFKLDAGSYKLEMTASGDGVSVEWLGSACPTSGQTNSMTMTCKMVQAGQLIVTNPTGLGMGASSNVTIKLIKLGREI